MNRRELLKSVSALPLAALPLFGVDQTGMVEQLARIKPLRNQSFKLNRTLHLKDGYDIQNCSFEATPDLKGAMIFITADVDVIFANNVIDARSRFIKQHLTKLERVA